IRHHIQQVLQSAEKNGAEIVNLQGTKIGEELIEYAHNRGITKIIIGKPVKPFWKRALSGSLADFITSEAGDTDVYVVVTPAPALLSQNFNRKRPPFSFPA